MAKSKKPTMIERRSTDKDAPDDLILTSEAAKFLGVSEVFLKKDRTAKTPVHQVPFVRLSPRMIRYRKSELEQWIAEKRLSNAPQEKT